MTHFLNLLHIFTIIICLDKILAWADPLLLSKNNVILFFNDLFQPNLWYISN